MKQNEEESKQINFQEIQNKRGTNISMTPQIYSIKVATKNKKEVAIIELIRNELDIVKDDSAIWNKIMRTHPV